MRRGQRQFANSAFAAVDTNSLIPPPSPLCAARQLTRTALSRLPHRLRRLHISLTGVAGQMALDFVAFADGQSVVYSGPSAAPTTVPANCTQA